MDHVDMDQDAVFATVFLAWYGVVVYSGQAILRGAVGVVLKRAVIRYSVVASVVSILFLGVMAVAATLENEWSWKAEPIAAILLALGTVAEGVRLIYSNSNNVEQKLEVDW